MKKILKYTLLILLGVLILIQFFRPAENVSAEVPHEQITAKYPIPENLGKTFKTACYDCHSNTTVYPFYWRIQPFAWFLNDHIVEGKRHFNFSTFSTYPIWRQYDKFKDIKKEIKEGDMPLGSYTFIHRDAILNESQKTAMINWADEQMKKMEAMYPADSLAKPKRR